MNRWRGLVLGLTLALLIPIILLALQPTEPPIPESISARSNVPGVHWFLIACEHEDALLEILDRSAYSVLDIAESKIGSGYCIILSRPPLRREH